jgi:sec-independent protein translocase protein TatA
MGIENPVHLLFIALVALIVLGPKRLPEVTRALGHGIREFRNAVSMQGEEPTAQQPAAYAANAQGPPPTAVSAAAPAEQPPVDPAQAVRSGDAPDRGSL